MFCWGSSVLQLAKSQKATWHPYLLALPPKLSFQKAFIYADTALIQHIGCWAREVEADPQQNSISPAIVQFPSKWRVVFLSLKIKKRKDEIFHCINKIINRCAPPPPNTVFIGFFLCRLCPQIRFFLPFFKIYFLLRYFFY